MTTGLVYHPGTQRQVKPGHVKALGHWLSMTTRCKQSHRSEKWARYGKCEVADEFYRFIDFAEWAEQQVGYRIDGSQLDKDLLVRGNLIYSPETCIFVPRDINMLLTKSNARRGDLPIGVTRTGESFDAKVSMGNKKIYLGRHATPEDAFAAYKYWKEAHIKVVAQRWKDQIDPRAYAALMQYEVQITD